jgi:hypothetical protein
MPHLLAVVAGAVATLVAYGVDAQEPDPNVPVTARPRPDYDPLGIRAGGFLIYPSTSVSGSYNDNILATNDDEQDDFIFTVSPQIAVRSNFPRHSLNFAVQSDVGRYVDHTDEDFWDFGAAMAGRLDITRNNRLTGSINAGREHEARDDPDDPGADVSREPVKYWVYGGTAGFEQDFNRFNFGLLGTFERNDYEEEDANEDVRDANLYGARLRTGYFISPRINTFLQGGYEREQRDASNRSQRDNNVYSAGVGTAIDFTGLLFGEAVVGWATQEFDDSQFQGSSGFTYGVNLTWNPTQLTSLRLDGVGGYEPSDVGASNLTHQIGPDWRRGLLYARRLPGQRWPGRQSLRRGPGCHVPAQPLSVRGSGLRLHEAGFRRQSRGVHAQRGHLAADGAALGDGLWKGTAR